MAEGLEGSDEGSGSAPTKKPLTEEDVERLLLEAERVFVSLAGADGNDDGAESVSKDELLDALGADSMQLFEPLFEQYDKDGSGEVTLDEWLDFIEDSHGKNGDEWLSTMVQTLNSGLVDEIIGMMDGNAKKIIIRLGETIALLSSGDTGVRFRVWAHNWRTAKTKSRIKTRLCGKSQVIFDVLAQQNKQLGGNETLSIQEIKALNEEDTELYSLLDCGGTGEVTSVEWVAFVRETHLAKEQNVEDSGDEWLLALLTRFQSGLPQMEAQVAPDNDGDIAFPQTEWFEVIGKLGGGVVMRQGADLQSEPAGEAPQGLICHISSMREVQDPSSKTGKKTRARICDPVEGWVSAAYIMCLSRSCGHCMCVDVESVTLDSPFAKARVTAKNAVISKAAEEKAAEVALKCEEDEIGAQVLELTKSLSADANEVSAAFRRLDGDKNGALSPDEFEAGTKPQAGPEETEQAACNEAKKAEKEAAEAAKQIEEMASEAAGKAVEAQANATEHTLADTINIEEKEATAAAKNVEKAAKKKTKQKVEEDVASEKKRILEQVQAELEKKTEELSVTRSKVKEAEMQRRKLEEALPEVEEKNAATIAKEIADLEAEIAAVEQTRVLEKKKVDLKHAEWESRISEAQKRLQDNHLSRKRLEEVEEKLLAQEQERTEWKAMVDKNLESNGIRQELAAKLVAEEEKPKPKPAIVGFPRYQRDLKNLHDALVGGGFLKAGPAAALPGGGPGAHMHGAKLTF